MLALVPIRIGVSAVELAGKSTSVQTIQPNDDTNDHLKDIRESENG
jgi:hypothetical protein